MYSKKGFKALGYAIVPILFFAQTAAAAPLSIVYQNKTSQNVQADYINALANPPMKAALTNALLAAEVANLPIFVTDDNGSVIDYTAAIGKSENYSVALTDSAVNHATAPVATQQMNADGSVTPVVPSNSFTFTTTSDLFGNTLVKVTVTASNVTGVTVKGIAATQDGTSNVWRAGLTGSVTVVNSDITLMTGNTTPTKSSVSVKSTPANVNSVLGGTQTITLIAEDAYGSPIPNRTIYLQPGIQGLWITQVNGQTISGLVNMGTSSSTSMQMISTPIPLFNLGTGVNAPAYTNVSVTDLTAYNLQTTPVVALITGADGKVSVTLADGNVTYLANTASATATNSYAVDAGTTISNKTLTISSDIAGTLNSGSVQVNWGGGTTSNNPLQSIGVSHTALQSNYPSISNVPQVASFSNVIGSDEQMYAAAYNQNGTIIAPAAGNQFDSYALVYDLLAPSGVYFERLGSVAIPVNPTHGGVGEVKAQFTQNGGFVILELIYTDGNIMYSNGTLTTAVAAPTGFDPTAYSNAYDGSGQINFYLNSNATTAVISSGIAGSVNINISAYSNSATTIDSSHAQGSAAGTINATFAAGNTIESLGVAANASGFSSYVPLLDGNAAPGATLTIAGLATSAANGYDSTKNASFVVAPFNSYPAISIIPSQGLTMNISSTPNGVISNVDGYTFASNPPNVTFNVNTLGEVSVNNVKLWAAQPGYKVVGYMPGATSSSVMLIEENISTLTSFIGVNVPNLGSAGSQVTSWTLPLTSLPSSFEGFLGFNVDTTGQLQPLVASYYATNGTFAPYAAVTGTATLAAGVYNPVEVAQVYASDKYPENPVITVSNSLNSKTAAVIANFTAATSGLVAVKASPSSVNSVLGGSQNVTLTALDAYGNPIANQIIYVGTGIPGLWITQVNGTAITSSVNMGTSSLTSMMTVPTPIPLYQVANAPAYDSASVTGVTAYHLQTAPVVALTTGVDGTVSITLVDGNVTYVANTATATVTNSYVVAPGTAISNKTITLYSDNPETTTLGSVLVNWGGGTH
ncbi:exported hypothetical protein [Candidatus Desulfosporosinus infrequens]|uniref:Uncharacterized protein n=1 Tax=Candidatus Desulfosporosinus infrequens TaxID=2043169 RepID=A0A2U3L4P7_9FIRM|nr:exported hypothetical protein [Candidatus Desulfosporosinus infrequens]